LKKEKIEISFPIGTSVLHRFYKEKGSRKVIFLIHGYFENGKIFYSDSGKGLAPYLAENGYDVFVCDLLGKGDSQPKVTKDFFHSQYDIVTRDIPQYLQEIRKITGVEKVNIGAHSWGGVVVNAYMLRSQDQNINAFVSFGSKRRISLNNPRKWVLIDFGWDYYGKYIAKKHGFLPGSKLKMGNENEPRDYYMQTQKWVASKEWKSEIDQFDYLMADSSNVAPSLYITGKGDKILGHPKDVLNHANEVNAKHTEVKIIGKETKHLHDYDHINLLTHKDAPKDHFPLVLAFLDRFNSL